MFLLDMYTCGGLENVKIDGQLLDLAHTAYLVILIAIPVILIVFGMLDMGKAVMEQKEDKIKEAQKLFVKRIISAVLVFLVVFLVKIIVGLVAGDQSDDIVNCIDCFLSGPESDSCILAN